MTETWEGHEVEELEELEELEDMVPPPGGEGGVREEFLGRRNGSAAGKR